MLAGLSFVLAMAGGPPKWMKVFQFADIKLGREKLTSVERRVGPGAEAGGDENESLRLYKMPNAPLWQVRLFSVNSSSRAPFILTGVSLVFKSALTKNDLSVAKIRNGGFWTPAVLKLKRQALFAKLRTMGMQIVDRDDGTISTMVYDHYQYLILARFDSKASIQQIDLLAVELPARTIQLSYFSDGALRL